MHILITGAFGFVGSNLSAALKTAGHYLIAVDLNQPAQHVYDEFHSWEDLAAIDWTGIDVIIHLAGKAHDTRNTCEEKTYFDINVGLTRQIFNCFLNSNTSKFIFFSSVKAVADSVQAEYLTEETESRPQTAYGKSKLEAERVIAELLSVADGEMGRMGGG